MKHVLAITLLAVLWCLLSASADPWTIVAGVSFGTGAWGLRLRFIRHQDRALRPIRPLYVVQLSFSFLYALFASAFSVAREAVRIRIKVHPGFVRYPVHDRSPAAVTALANLISLTPGTLSLDVSEDCSELYVHVLQGGDDPEAVRAELHQRLEAPMNRAFPPPTSETSD